LSKSLSVQLDALNLVQCFGSQVTLSTVGTTNNWHILNNQQIRTLTVTAGDITHTRTFLTTNITNHRLSSLHIHSDNHQLAGDANLGNHNR
jgi:hypothetical protein